MKKIFTLTILAIMLCSFLVFAQENKIQYQTTNTNLIQTMNQYHNRVQERYNYTCSGNCSYLQNEATEEIQLQVKEQKRFLFWNVNSEDNYILNENEQ